MKHWTSKFFIDRPELWLHLMNRGWEQAGMTMQGIVKILKKHGVSGGKFLELACGNGRICLPMAKRGFAVTGVDISPAFIEDAKNRAKKGNVRARFICGDIRKIDKIVDEKFDVVLSIWTSVGFYDKKTDERIFGKAAQRTRKNGLFLILNTMSQEYLLNHYYANIFDETDTFVVLHRNSRFDRFRSRIRDNWVFYEKDGKGLKYVDELNLDLKVYSTHEIIEMAEKAGFEYLEAYDSLDTLQPAHPDSVINVIFRKRE